MKSILSLPVPILHRILSQLPIQDKKNVSLVCLYLWKIISFPSMWSPAQVKSQQMCSVEKLTKFFSIPRYSLLLTLDLSNLKYPIIDKTVITQLLKYLQNNSSLVTVRLTNTNVSQVPAFPLSSGLAHVTTLELSNTRLETEQLNGILGKCCRGKYTKNVDFSYNNFTYVNTELLAASVLTLESVNLSYTDLSPIYSRRVMQSVRDSTVSVLNMSGNDLSDCKLDNIALNQNLRVLKMSEVKFRPENLESIFSNMTLIHNLEELCLDGTALGDVDPILLSDAVVRVVRVDLNFCWLYCDHVEFIFDAITAQTRLKYLNLSGNHLENVNIDLMLNALHHLNVCRMEWANLTEEHFEALISDTGDLKENNTVILNHFELIENFVDLHRKAKLNTNIQLNMVKG